MSEDDDKSGGAGGMMDSVKRLGRSFAATVHNRAELFVIELQEEGIRFVGALLLAGLVMLLSGLALIMGMFAVLLSVGEEHRLLAAVIMTAILLAGAAGAAFWLMSKLKRWSAFSATRAELRKDREWVQSNTSKN